MKLLEVVRAKCTSNQTISSIMTGITPRIEKVAVLVGNCPDFVGNRMLRGYGLEANFMLEEGAMPQQVDNALRNFGYPMGPLQVSDLSGLDVGWRVRQEKFKKNPSIRYSTRYVEIADKLYELGRLGQKTKKGWYDYSGTTPEELRKPIPSKEVEALILQHSNEKNILRRTFTDDEIVERCVFPLINEGFKILEDKIALRSSDIDVIQIYGYGFPRFRGGPMYYSESVGLKHVLKKVEEYHKKFPNVPHWIPSSLMATLANSNQSLRQLDQQFNKARL